MKEYFTNEMIFVKANAEKDDSTTAKMYNVSGYPTFVITEANGEEIDRIVGYMIAEDFLSTVKDYRNGIGTLDDLLAKAKDSTDRTLFFEIAEKYKYRGGSEEAMNWFGKVIDAGDAKDSLAANSRVATADMTIRNKDYDKALELFGAIEKDFAGSAHGETAILYSAYIYRSKINDTTKSITEYERFLKKYPESEDAEYVSKKIKELKGEVETNN